MLAHAQDSQKCMPVVTREFQDIKLLRQASPRRMKWPSRNISLSLIVHCYPFLSMHHSRNPFPEDSPSGTAESLDLTQVPWASKGSLLNCPQTCMGLPKDLEFCLHTCLLDYLLMSLSPLWAWERREPSLTGLDFYSTSTEPKTECIQFKTELSL